MDIDDEKLSLVIDTVKYCQEEGGHSFEQNFEAAQLFIDHLTELIEHLGCDARITLSEVESGDGATYWVVQVKQDGIIFEGDEE